MIDDFNLYTLPAFLLAIAVLVTIHEFGHFWVARKLGVKVLTFSVGFGRKIWRYVSPTSGVEYCISLIPLGGYVKMLDEREGDVAPELLPRAFNRQVLWKRAAIVVAGPLANFLLAILLYMAILAVGVPELRPVVDAPKANSPAEKAGLQLGDEIISINGENVMSWRAAGMALHESVLNENKSADLVVLRQARMKPIHVDLRTVSPEPEAFAKTLGLNIGAPPVPLWIEKTEPSSPAANAGLQANDKIIACGATPETLQEMPSARLVLACIRGENAARSAPVTLKIARDDQELTVTMTPKLKPDDKGIMQRMIGVALMADPSAAAYLQVTEKFSGLDLPIEATQRVASLSWKSLEFIGYLIKGELSVKNVGGAIQIAQFAGLAAESGLTTFLTFLALISISLGVMNLLPIPMLDGGHLLYYLAEAIYRRPLPERAAQWGQNVGLALLLALMGLAFFNDIMRLVGVF